MQGRRMAANGGGGAGRERGVGGGGGGQCLTLHQPWASLLVHGIKRIEGRTWPCPMRGRLWIHAASKVPEDVTIARMEDFYRQVYEVDGVTNVDFPEHYPVSVLLGCVEVVGCLLQGELENWEDVSQGVRLEAQSEFCWLCENPQKLVIPYDMRGRQGLYNLPKKTLAVAPKALRKVEGPAPVTFPPLDDSDPFSLKPGCLVNNQTATGRLPAGLSSSKLETSIAGARIAALQFKKQDTGSNRKEIGHQGSSSSLGLADLTDICLKFEQKQVLKSKLDKRENRPGLTTNRIFSQAVQQSVGNGLDRKPTKRQ